MITTSIMITPYLAEYLRGKYNNGADEPIRIPDNTDLYHVIWTLMSSSESISGGQWQSYYCSPRPTDRKGPTSL